jgi:hypothetical protein
LPDPFGPTRCHPVSARHLRRHRPEPEPAVAADDAVEGEHDIGRSGSLTDRVAQLPLLARLLDLRQSLDGIADASGPLVHPPRAVLPVLLLQLVARPEPGRLHASLLRPLGLAPCLLDEIGALRGVGLVRLPRLRTGEGAGRPVLGPAAGVGVHGLLVHVEFEDARRHRVQERAVVGRDQHRRRQPLHEPGQRGQAVGVQVVRGLVQQQQVVPAHQDRRQPRAGGLPAREAADRALQRHVEVEPGEHLCEPHLEVRPAEGQPVLEGVGVGLRRGRRPGRQLCGRPLERVLSRPDAGAPPRIAEDRLLRRRR